MIKNIKMELEHELRLKIDEYYEIEAVDNPWIKGYLAGEINTLARVLVGNLPVRKPDEPYEEWLEKVKVTVLAE